MLHFILTLSLACIFVLKVFALDVIIHPYKDLKDEITVYSYAENYEHGIEVYCSEGHEDYCEDDYYEEDEESTTYAPTTYYPPFQTYVFRPY